ncbi:trypsinogen-like protein 3 [Phyllopteryx taeniolatus]|uniref:trypsinogen-like protein 3 n=1 Tax=Phyllopteryx taeniolatus TaxID=161469 RepID=UPI002AD25080|nr:trypsinogen-like protein 3 [Phyllopteryx taeniolatus]
MELLLLLFALGLTGASPLEDHDLCQPHSRPWQVSLHDRGTRCSGALINQWWLVTSAACAPRSTSVIASLGEHDVTVDESTEQHIPVADVIRHSPYRSPLHSLAMVRLAEPARLTPHVRPIGLPGRCPQPGESCSVSGWGSTVPNQYESLKAAEVFDCACCGRSNLYQHFPRLPVLEHGHGVRWWGQDQLLERQRRSAGVRRAAAGHSVVQSWLSE